VTPSTPDEAQMEVSVATRPAADGKVSFQVGPGQNAGASLSLTAAVEQTKRAITADFIVLFY
jgi:hypothetical protein